MRLKIHSFRHVSQMTEGRAENDGAAVFCLRNPPEKPPDAPHRRWTTLLCGPHSRAHPLKWLTVSQTVTKETGNI